MGRNICKNKNRNFWVKISIHANSITSGWRLVEPVHLNGLLMAMVIFVIVISGPLNSGVVINGHSKF
jgi:hypothetical protein